MVNFEEHSYEEVLITKILAEEATPDEEGIFQKKWKASETFRNAYFEIKEIWDTTGVLPKIQNLDIEKATNNFTSRINNVEKRQNIKILITKFILTAAAAILAGLIIWNVFIKNKTIEIIATNNPVNNLILPDSSIISLNRNSKFTYSKRFNRKYREVNFSGEGYFRIKENKKRPFVITSGIACIKVLGTSFNVNCTNDNIIISVDNGSVLLSIKDSTKKNIILKSGESGRISIKDSVISKIGVIDPNYKSWLTGIIKFDNSRLSEAVKVFEQYYSAKFIFQDKNIEDYRLTANFNNQTLHSVVDILELTFNINITEQDSIFYIMNRNPK